MHDRPRRLAVAGALTAFALSLVAACGNTASQPPSATAPSATSTPMGSSTSSVPATTEGMPGMNHPSTASSAATASTFNAADVMFAQMMIEHHQGAIEMANLAFTRADSPKVKELAGKIKGAQQPEIDRMKSWLAVWSPNTSASGSGGMSGMPGMNHNGPGASGSAVPGMMTSDQMKRLMAASGPAFDKLFLQLMIQHHQGAIEMASTEWEAGSNPDALALAQAIVTDQTAEIATMQTMLQGT